MTNLAHIEAAEKLWQAEYGKTLTPLVSVDYPEFTIDDAYAIQMHNVGRRIAAGGKVRGYKIGLSSKAAQLQVGVSEPDYGHIFADTIISSSETIAAADLCQPGAEPEIAFVLKAELGGPDVNAADVIRATDYVLPAIEIVGSRVIRDSGHPFTIVDTVADNAGTGRVVLGTNPVYLSGVDLSNAGVVIRRNGEIFDTGSTAAVMGHPVVSVAWLANKLHGHGIVFKPGDIIMSGSCTTIMRKLSAKEAVSASFQGIGTVNVSFC